MAIKELVTRFGFEIDDHGLKELSEGIEAVKEGILHLGEALIGEAVGLYELVEKAAESGVQLKIMSQQSGIAAEKLQELQFRAKLADVSTEDLNQSMNLLARRMIEAKNGGAEAQKQFRQVGITTAELRAGTVTTDGALERISRRFEKLADGPKKTALAMEIFGRSGARMVPFLNGLHNALDPVNAEILKMSLVTEDQIEAAEEFHVNIETLKTGLLGIARVIGFGLMPTVTSIIETMKKWIVENRQLIVQDLTAFVKGMAAALRVTVKIVDALIKSFAGFANGIGGVESATKILLGTFAVLSGATVLWGIGKVIQAVVELGNAFAIANLKAALIPVLIGAAMITLGLIMEDIYSYFTGKKSFLGDLLEKIPSLGKMFKDVFEPIFEPIVTLITAISDGVYSWGDLFKQLGVIMVNTLLTPLRIAGDSLASILRLASYIPGLKGLKGAADFVSDVSGNLKLDSVTPSGYGPKDAVASSGGPGGKQQNNDVQIRNEFNFPPGTDPSKTADKVANGVATGVDEALRNAHRSLYSAGAY